MSFVPAAVHATFDSKPEITAGPFKCVVLDRSNTSTYVFILFLGSLVQGQSVLAIQSIFQPLV